MIIVEIQLCIFVYIGVSTVSCDDWLRRDFSSLYRLYGLVAVMSVDTGKVIDYHILSKVCYSCRY